MVVNQQLGIHLVKLPLPFRLNHVNCYAIQGARGWTLVDAGLNNEATQQAWQEFFNDRAINALDITGIYLTHFHPDHYGAAGWLQQLTGAPVFMSDIDAQRVNSYWKNSEHTLGSLGRLFSQHGMPAEETAGVIEAMAKLIPMTEPHAEVTVLEAGQTVQLGDYLYRVLHTPGHTDGHICFYNEEHGVMFSGDHLLPRISSNISLWPQPGAEVDPLARFIGSLSALEPLDCRLVFPAHGHSFECMHQRVEQLLQHHEDRLGQVKAAAGRGHTGYEVCREIFSQQLSMHELRFAMAEALAHLMHLAYKGEVELVSREGVNLFKAKLPIVD